MSTIFEKVTGVRELPVQTPQNHISVIGFNSYNLHFLGTTLENNHLQNLHLHICMQGQVNLQYKLGHNPTSTDLIGMKCSELENYYKASMIKKKENYMRSAVEKMFQLKCWLSCNYEVLKMNILV